MIINFSNIGSGQGGGSGSGVTPEDVQRQIDSALTPYWESAQTESAITEAVSGLATEEYVQEAISGISLDGYWTSAETKDYVDEATEDFITSAYTGFALAEDVEDFEKVTASALTELHDQIVEIDEVIPAAIVDLNEKIAEISGDTPDLSDYWTSAQTQDAISAATSGKADAASTTANTNTMLFPKWNSQGVITGNIAGTRPKYLYINGQSKEVLGDGSYNNTLARIYAPESAGTAGQILVSAGNGAPVWSAVTMGGVSQEYVDSAITQVQDQLDTIDEVIPAAIVDINNRMVSSSSVSTIWRGTQAEYDAITTKDPNTLYIIVNE